MEALASLASAQQAEYQQAQQYPHEVQHQPMPGAGQPVDQSPPVCLSPVQLLGFHHTGQPIFSVYPPDNRGLYPTANGWLLHPPIIPGTPPQPYVPLLQAPVIAPDRSFMSSQPMPPMSQPMSQPMPPPHMQPPMPPMQQPPQYTHEPQYPHEVQPPPMQQPPQYPQ